MIAVVNAVGMGQRAPLQIKPIFSVKFPLFLPLKRPLKFPQNGYIGEQNKGEQAKSSKMDSSESTKIVYCRIQKLEPELVSKIVGYLLLQNNGERDMIRLAFSPDNVIYTITNKAKVELGFAPANQPSFSQNSPPTSLHLPSTNSYWNPQPQPLTPDHNVIQEYYLQLQHQMQLLGLDDQPEFPGSGNRYNPRFELPSKVCHYFSKGFCKHGSSCRYLHGNPNDGFTSDDQLFSPRSVEKLEFELTELLKSRNGEPVSIALLPMLYYEKFGRTLQAEGYLTESQRHGKAGYSLTKLLARMRPRIHIIERAHGQHSVILAEDLVKFLEFTSDQSEHGLVPIGARQIYLTFPAESVFNEQDVSNYFSGFGPVQDVRIPCQQKRMFGFVTFLYPETVRKILAKGNPHFICGARVLVKPYREKSRLAERKNAERKHPAHFCLQFDDADPNIPNNLATRGFNSTRLVRKQFMEDQEELQELERRMSEIQLLHKPQTTDHGFDYSTTELNTDEGYGEQAEFMTSERLSFLLDVLKDESTGEENSQRLDLPESPFANSIVNSISTSSGPTRQMLEVIQDGHRSDLMQKLHRNDDIGCLDYSNQTANDREESAYQKISSKCTATYEEHTSKRLQNYCRGN
ncbi:hypothetical protein V2J09_006522 [Rumex salicifolius]